MTVTLNHNAIDQFSGIFGEAGLAHLDAVGKAVAVRAQQLLAERTHQRTGALMGSIHSELGRDAIGPFAKVSASAINQYGVDYASFIEYGTTPHSITPRNPQGWLASGPDNPTPLESPRKAVNHPGQVIPIMFLHDARREITGQ